MQFVLLTGLARGPLFVSRKEISTLCAPSPRSSFVSSNKLVQTVVGPAFMNLRTYNPTLPKGGLNKHIQQGNLIAQERQF